MSKGIAFFDFDNTIIRGDVGPLFGDYILGNRFQRIKEEQGIKAARADRAKLLARYTPYIAWFGVQACLYKMRAVRRSKITRSAYRALKGVPANEYYPLMAEFAEQELPDRIFPEMVDVINSHLAAGREVVFITTGIQKLVEHCLPHLPGPIHVIGCILKEKDGIFTGKVSGPLYGADKANIINAYCQASEVDPATCYAYSDHYSDYHMMDAVGHGVCVNPNARLTKMADERGWDVVRPVSPMEVVAQ